MTWSRWQRTTTRRTRTRRHANGSVMRQSITRMPSGSWVGFLSRDLLILYSTGPRSTVRAVRDLLDAAAKKHDAES